MILLDTHVFIWLASDQRKLSKRILQLMQKPGQSAAISVVTSWEIALLSKRGLLNLPVSPAEFIERAIAQHQLSELPLSRSLIFEAVNLPDIHNDPFDRILVATAMENRMPLISKDATIAEYPGVDVLW